MNLNVVNSPLINGVKKCTSDYKTRNSKRPKHNGMDLISGNSKNNYIIAIEDGTVSSVSYQANGAGYYVYITHNNGYRSFYAHMLKGSIVVKKGQSIKKGERIGTMGTSGSSSGIHLHFGIKNKNNVWVDPKPYLEGTKVLKNQQYKLLYDKCLRKQPKVAVNKIIKVKAGTIITSKDNKIYSDIKNNKWVYTTINNKTGYICIEDNTGIQASII